MHPAQACRIEKEKHPERFCLAPRCLWRVKYPDGPDRPCLKHPVVLDLMEVLKKSLKERAGV